MNQNYNGVRNRLLGAALLALTATLSVRADYQSTVLSQGPVGYWRLNETATPPYNAFATNYGSLGAAANGPYVGSPTHELAGPFTGSSALGVAGANTSAAAYQYVNNAWVAGLNTSNFTFEVWLKPDAVPVPGVAYVASSVDFSTAPARSGWYLAQDAAPTGTFGYGSAYVFRTFYGNGSTGSATVAAPVPPLGTWVHLVVTCDQTTLRMYTNGVLAMSAPMVGGYLPNIAAPFTLGCRSTANFQWSGKAAETAIYGTALSSTQVAAHYSAATSAVAYVPAVQADAPLLYHRYLEPKDTVAGNLGSAGSAANGLFQYGSIAGAVGPRPSAYPGFDSTNTAAATTASGASIAIPALNLNTNTITISAWLNASNMQSAAAGIIMCDAGNTYSGLNVDVITSPGSLGLGYTWNNDINTYNWSPTVDSGLPQLPDSDWAYVALVVSPTSASIYLALTNGATTFTSVTNYYTHVAQNFDGVTLLGSDGGAAAYSFRGAIDEVAIFKRSLGAGEVYSQFASAIGGLKPIVFNDPQPPVDPVYAGDTLTLTVDAGGTPALGYQWYKTSGPIAGATGTSYTKANAQTSDSDNYSVVITNQFGSVTSLVASVTINPAFAPSITTPPIGHVLYPGGTLNLSVVATGGGLKYQWQRSGTNLPGATAATYSKYNVTTNDSGSYSVVVSNNVSTVSGGPVTITVLAPANDYETAIVADKPEAWFRLNESSGTTMYDSMGRHDGVYTNLSGSPVTFGAAGAIVGNSDKAVTFDGTSASYGVVPYSSALNNTTLTIEAWVKTTDTSVTRCAVSSRSSVPQGYWLYSYPVGSWSGGVSQSGNNYYVPSETASAAIVSGEWKHVVMVYDTSLKVYINGQWDGNGYVDFERNVSAPFIIGGRGGSTVDYLMNGQVDEVLVYTNGLTLAQVQSHYSKAKFPTPTAPYFLAQPSSHEVLSNAAVSVTLDGPADGSAPISYQWFKNGVAVSAATNASLTLSATYSNAGSYVLRASNSVATTNTAAAVFAVVSPNPAYVNVTNGLVLHLKFDGSYTDSSGRGNNATAVGTPAIVPGRLGSGVFLSTSNSLASVNYLTLGTPTDLNFGSAVDFSVAYWVKYDASQTNGDLPFLCSAINSYGNPGFTFAPSYNQGGWSFSLNGTVQNYGDPNTINDGNWHHLIHSINRTGNAVTYLDGREVDSRLAIAAGNLDTGNAVNIGQDPTGAYAEDGSVTLDDLGVWRRALTQYEAYAIYYAATNSGTSFDIPGTVTLNIAASGTNAVLSWHPGPTLGKLLQADSLTGPWTQVPAYAPVYQVPATAAQKFYRLSFSE